ncbi:ACT domain-containing protein [Salipiger sp. PrR002]|uniref:ACT domain-containing protein n=1 Tax=Salipiger sp. PrR002 TaxID=2706489 RepID=UPI0013BD547D|nr:ACT domain-containing protein [Salipiger sp. PrR002]NDV99073.1 ACT domain-containing protein [Salipiger sp. PrR002]NDW56026.1 ACT domain-containing protein [Salipiger sp. PrR004]
MSLPKLSLVLLPQEHAILRLPPDAPFPDWTGASGCVSLTRAPDELSVVCPAAAVPAGTEGSFGWRAFRVDTLAGLDEPGVVLAAVKPLSEAGLGVFVISTFLRDYLLVSGESLGRAHALLTEAGHRITAG